MAERVTEMSFKLKTAAFDNCSIEWTYPHKADKKPPRFKKVYSMHKPTEDQELFLQYDLPCAFQEVLLSPIRSAITETSKT